MFDSAGREADVAEATAGDAHSLRPAVVKGPDAVTSRRGCGLWAPTPRRRERNRAMQAIPSPGTSREMRT